MDGSDELNRRSRSVITKDQKAPWPSGIGLPGCLYAVLSILLT